MHDSYSYWRRRRPIRLWKISFKKLLGNFWNCYKYRRTFNFLPLLSSFSLSTMPLCAQDSAQVQHKFEQAVWEVSFVLQKSADDPAPGGAKQKEYVARIRQALVSFFDTIHLACT